MKTNIILVDDHAMILEGLSSLLAKEEDFYVAARLSSPDEVDSFIKGNVGKQFENTVAVVDLSFKGFTPPESYDGAEAAGFSIIRQLTAAGIRCIVYSMHSYADYVRNALSDDVGAKGYVLKDGNNSNIFNAIKSVASGGIFIQEELLSALSSRSQKVEFFLTSKERAVARLVMQGYSNDVIAEKLSISKRTVENYMSRIYDKTGCENRFACIEFLRENL